MRLRGPSGAGRLDDACYTLAMAAPDDSYDPLTPVPAIGRIFSGGDAFSLWFSLGIGLLVLQAGAFLVPGLSLPQAFGAILVGSVLGVLLLALAGVVGADTGLSAIANLRNSRLPDSAIFHLFRVLSVIALRTSSSGSKPSDTTRRAMPDKPASDGCN